MRSTAHMGRQEISGTSSAGARALRELSVNDWLVIAYLTTLNLALLPAAASPEKSTNQWRFLTVLLGYLAVLAWTRYSVSAPQKARAFVYRATQFASLPGTYLLLRDFLPVVNTGSLDLELYQVDLWLFGVEPALYLEPYTTPIVTEWFAFFYYSYFYIVLVHTIPVLFFSKDLMRVAQFGLGMTLVATIGHTTYMLVPGFGPFRALAEHFNGPLQGGFFWRLVLETVAAGGAQKDIFPSLHTAFPSFIALFSFHHRAHRPYSYTWPVVAFFVINIIGATMILRWHYLIDVVAGLILAVGCYLASVRIPNWEARTREQRRLQPVWPPWT